MCELVGLLAGEVESCPASSFDRGVLGGGGVVCVVGFRTLTETRFVNCRKWSITFLSPLRLARQEFGPQFFPKKGIRMGHDAEMSCVTRKSQVPELCALTRYRRNWENTQSSATKWV